MNPLGSSLGTMLGMVFYNVGWCMAILLAPVIGGLLAEPATKYHEAMEYFPSGVVDKLQKFPFLLPNLIAATINVISVIIFAFKLEETRQGDEDASTADSEKDKRLDRLPSGS